MARKRVKNGDKVRVINKGDLWHGYIGTVTDRYSGDGKVLFHVRFKHGNSGWYSLSDLTCALEVV